MSVNPLILYISTQAQMQEISRKLVISFKEINDMCREALMYENTRIAAATLVEKQKQLIGSQPVNQKQPTEGSDSIEEIVVGDKKNKKQPVKRVKKPLPDPDLPKKPLGSYMMFQKERKPEILEKSPSTSFPELAKILGKEWQKLDDSAKSIFQNKAKAARKKYEKDMEEYRKKHPDYEQPKRKKKAQKESSESSEKIEISASPMHFNQRNSISQQNDSLGQDL